jgi:hypothetical protein
MARNTWPVKFNEIVQEGIDKLIEVSKINRSKEGGRKEWSI